MFFRGAVAKLLAEIALTFVSILGLGLPLTIAIIMLGVTGRIFTH
jgi:hypothetical protein